MAVLSAMQGVAWSTEIKIPYLLDIAEACRFLICAPLLIVAEVIVEPWARNVISHFRELVPTQEQAQFAEFIEAATRARDRYWVEILLLCFALLRPHFDASISMLHGVPSWQIANGIDSWAKIYSIYVCKPLMGWLWLRWMYKYAIWSLLLVRISTLSLRLIPTHPDDAAGLNFVAIGQTKFSILSAAFSIMAVGALADDILFEGATLMEFRYVVLGVVALSLLIFSTPLLAFTPKLIDCKRLGLFNYGKLAQNYVEDFDVKWISKRSTSSEDLLGHADVQTLADMESAYSVVQSMRISIIDKSFLISFVLAGSLPFAPLLLTVYPIDELLDKVLKSFL